MRDLRAAGVGGDAMFQRMPKNFRARCRSACSMKFSASSSLIATKLTRLLAVHAGHDSSFTNSEYKR
jgi:hypothetical protein